VFLILVDAIVKLLSLFILVLYIFVEVEREPRIYSFHNNLSIVVLTQNKRCSIIPKLNKKIDVYKKDILKKYDIRKAPRIVILTSATAKFKKR